MDYIIYTRLYRLKRNLISIFSDYQSPPIIIIIAILQKSPFLPILFFFFVSNLFNTFKKGATQRIGFVNNTNLITYGPTAAGNCRTLKKAHNACIKWAKQYKVQFLLEKYQLIHFIRKYN